MLNSCSSQMSECYVYVMVIGASSPDSDHNFSWLLFAEWPFPAQCQLPAAPNVSEAKGLLQTIIWKHALLLKLNDSSLPVINLIQTDPSFEMHEMFLLIQPFLPAPFSSPTQPKPGPPQVSAVTSWLASLHSTSPHLYPTWPRLHSTHLRTPQAVGISWSETFHGTIESQDEAALKQGERRHDTTHWE